MKKSLSLGDKLGSAFMVIVLLMILCQMGIWAYFRIIGDEESADLLSMGAFTIGWIIAVNVGSAATVAIGRVNGGCRMLSSSRTDNPAKFWFMWVLVFVFTNGLAICFFGSFIKKLG